MKETLYVKATPQDREEIVDFANFVFSQAHGPHDFKTLLPKTYADDVEGIEDWHFLAKQEGRIRAMVACRPTALHMAGKTLNCGFIGTVSVHPYSRGEGHMKHLMKMAMDDAKERGYDMLILGGQRQRYNYFGFEHAGVILHYHVTSTNLRHVLKEMDVSHISFETITENTPEYIQYAQKLTDKLQVHGDRPLDTYLHTMHSWNCTLRLVKVNGQPFGYVMGEVSEMVLEDNSLLLPVLKALMLETGFEHINLYCAPCETEKIRILSAVCENRDIGTFEMLNILNYKNVTDTLLTLKSTYAPLSDGVFTLQVENNPSFTIRVKDNQVSVQEENLPADKTLSHLDGEKLLLSLESAVCGSELPAGWLPLPFTMSPADTF